MTTQPAYPGVKVACPHPECEGVIKVAWALSGGVYPCPCQSCQVHVSWATYLDGKRTAYLSLEPPAPSTDNRALSVEHAADGDLGQE